jgi:autotransporter-associated beta strand protein
VALGGNTLTLSNASGTFTGGIGGTGGLTLTTGTETLSGTNSYTGATTINGGMLAVDGSIATSSLTTVNAGGTLTGTGTVGSASVAGGTYAPGGGAAGTKQIIAGSLAFTSGVYQVYLNPATSSYASVTGTATLAGGTVNAAFAAGSYVSHDYEILAGAHHGAFAGLTTSGAPAGFAETLDYSNPAGVYLDLTATLGAIGTSGLDQNQKNVATALDTYFNNGGTLPPNFVGVFGLTGGALGNALSELDGEVATGAERSAFQLMTEFLGLMLDPFVDARVGVGGGSTSFAGATGFAPEEQTSLPADLALAYAGVLKAAPSIPSPAGGGGSGFDQRWSAWGGAYGGASTASGDPAVGSNTVSTQTYGSAVGLDYHVDPRTVVGFALAGGGTNWGLANALGTGRSDAFQVGTYGVTWRGPLYLAGALAFTNHWFTTNRSALGDQLTANFSGQSYGGRIEAGYRYVASPLPTVVLGVTPYAAVQVQDFQTPSYSESDVTGGGFGLSYAAMNATDTRTELGTRFDAPTLVYGLPLILRSKVAWAHDFVSSPALSAAFESLPGAGFTVNGAPIPHDSALVSAGAQLFITPNWSLLAKFDGEFAAGTQTYAGNGTLRYAW